jgi:hypothetical protein
MLRLTISASRRLITRGTTKKYRPPSSTTGTSITAGAQYASKLQVRYQTTDAIKLIPSQIFDFSTLVELQVGACKAYKSNPCFGTRTGEEFEWVNYEEFGDLVQKVLIDSCLTIFVFR